MSSSRTKAARMCHLLQKRCSQRILVDNKAQRLSNTANFDIRNTSSKSQGGTLGTQHSAVETPSLDVNNPVVRPEVAAVAAGVLSSEDLEQILTLALEDVRELSDFVAKSSSLSKLSPSSGIASPIIYSKRTDHTIPTKNANDFFHHEVAAAESLLRLTSHPSFRQALDQQRKKNKLESTSKQQNVDVSSLHMAFITVTSWILSTIHANQLLRETNNPIDAFNIVLKLHERSLHLHLPLTLQLYESILCKMARYSAGPDVGIKLLDFTTQVQHILNYHSSDKHHDEIIVDPIPTIQIGGSKIQVHRRDLSEIDVISDYNSNEKNMIPASFFSNTLKELVHRNYIRDTVEVIEGMKSIHGIGALDLALGMELLSILKHQVETSLIEKNITKHHVDEVEETDDLLAAQQNVSTTKNSLTSTTDSFNEEKVIDETDAMELAVLLQQPIMDALEVRRKEISEYHHQLSLALESSFRDVSPGSIDDDYQDDIYNRDTVKKEVATEFWDDEEDESDLILGREMYQLNRMVESLIHIDDNNKCGMSSGVHSLMIKDLVYVRDSNFELPDIVPQLEEWNGERSVLFTPEFEQRLLSNILSDNDDLLDDE